MSVNTRVFLAAVIGMLTGIALTLNRDGDIVVYMVTLVLSTLFMYLVFDRTDKGPKSR